MAMPDMPQVEIAIVEMTNEIRKQHKLGAVKIEPNLAKTAQGYARFLAQSGLFSHTADGRQPADRAKAAGYAPCLVSENLSSNLDTRGFQTRQLANEAVQGWMNSPGHRKNILTEHVVEIGVGVAKVKSQEKYISVQIFGRPYSMAYSFRIDNASNQQVSYAFLDRSHDIKPRFTSKHTACMPGNISFQTGKNNVIGEYEARDGDIYALRTEGKGVKVDLTRRKKAP